MEIAIVRHRHDIHYIVFKGRTTMTPFNTAEVSTNFFGVYLEAKIMWKTHMYISKTINYLHHPRRAALEKWKQKLGSNATYSNLISRFEDAGYHRYADVIYQVLQIESSQSTTASNVTIAPQQPLLKTTKCTLS